MRLLRMFGAGLSTAFALGSLAPTRVAPTDEDDLTGVKPLMTLTHQAAERYQQVATEDSAAVDD